MPDDDRWQTLAAEYLKKLARNDMRIWRSRSMGQDARIEDQPMPSGMAKLIGELKRVRHQKREEG